MVLNITPPNFAGLAALAGTRTGGLGLSVPGELGLKAIQLRQAQEESRRQTALEQMRIQQQGLLGLRQQQLAGQQLQQQGLLGQSDLTMRQRELEQRALASQNQFNLGQQQLASNERVSQSEIFGRDLVSKRQAAMDALKEEMKRLAEEKKETLEEKGAFAASGLLALKQAKTPEEAQIIRTEFLKEALSKKYISKEEADTAASSPLSKFTQMLQFKAMQYGKAKEYKDMTAAVGEPSPVIGTKARNKAQEDVIAADDALKHLESLYDAPPDYFGAAALKYETQNPLREWGKDIPEIGLRIALSEEEKVAQERYKDMKANSEHLAMKIVKDLSGVQYSDKQLKYLKEILPSIGPGTVESTFRGRLNFLKNYYIKVKEARQKILSDGDIEFGSKEYRTKMSNEIDNIHSELRESTKKRYKYNPNTRRLE